MYNTVSLNIINDKCKRDLIADTWSNIFNISKLTDQINLTYMMAVFLLFPLYMTNTVSTDLCLALSSSIVGITEKRFTANKNY